MSFSRSSEVLLTGDQAGLSLWNVASGKRERRFDGEWGFYPHPCPSPDLRTIAVCRDKGLQLLDVRTGELSEPFDGKPSTASSLAFSPDGKRLVGACFDGKVRIWDVKERKEVQWFEGRTGFAVAISPDGRTLAFQQRRIVFVDLTTAQPSFQAADTAGILRAVLLPDGKTAIAGGISSIVRSWDVETGKQRREFDHGDSTTGAMAVSADGRLLACAGSEGIITVWELETGKRVASLGNGQSPFISLAFSPNDAELISTSADSTMRFWDVRGAREIEAKRVALDSNEPEFVDAELSPDGKTIALGRRPSGAVELWRAAPLKRESILLTGGEALILPIAFTPNSSRLAMPESFAQVIPRGRIRSRIKIVDLKTQEKVGATAGAQEMISAVAFSPDGKMLASAEEHFGTPGSIHVWSAKTGTKLLSLTGHQDNVRSLTFTPDSSRLVSASEDTTLLVWDLSPARESLERQEGNRNGKKAEGD